MKKHLFTLLAAVASVTGVFAQGTSLIATLEHGGTLTTYYGADALKEANEAAEDGDYILLSAGTFNAVDLSKNITVRGAGMQRGAEDVQELTTLSGDFTVTTTKRQDYYFTLEGVNCRNNVTLKGIQKEVYFTKCCFTNVVINESLTPQFTHCYIKQIMSDGSNANNQHTTIRNSVAINAFTGSGYFTFEHSVVSPYWQTDLPNSSLKNCIVFPESYGYRVLHSSSSAYSCVAVGSSDFLNGAGTYQSQVGEVFETYNGGDISETETFRLTDYAQANYLGNDGTQVGIYGGAMPFSPIPSGTRVKKMTLDSEQKDGKLNVTVEVE